MAEQLIDKQMFPISVEMKDALGQFATTQNISVAEAIRQAIATAIGYTYEHRNGAGAPKKYASEDDRKAAQKARNKDKRELVKVLLEERRAQLAAAQKQANIDAVKKTLPENK